MIVWGGFDGTNALNTGGRYCAAATEPDTHANTFSDPNRDSYTDNCNCTATALLQRRPQRNSNSDGNRNANSDGNSNADAYTIITPTATPRPSPYQGLDRLPHRALEVQN